MYSPSGAGCSLGNEAGTSAGRRRLPPPAAMCSLGPDSADGDLQARAAGWPGGSGRSCPPPTSAAGVTGTAEHTPVWTARWSGWRAAESSGVGDEDEDEEDGGSTGLRFAARCLFVAVLPAPPRSSA